MSQTIDTTPGKLCYEAALRYLDFGWCPLALCPSDHAGIGSWHTSRCNSPGKSPWYQWKNGKKNFQEQRPTTDEIKNWWHENKLANVGIALGPVSGLVRVDVDCFEGEAKLLAMSRGEVPPTIEFTSGKGRGLLYRIPEGMGDKLKTTPFKASDKSESVRFQAKGALTVLPPSRHHSGNVYSWVRDPREFDEAMMPDWLVEALLIKPKPASVPSRNGTHHHNGTDDVWKRAFAYLETIPPAVSGQGGHNQTMIAARVVVYGFDLGIEQGLSMLNSWNQRCSPPWSDAELRHKCEEADKPNFDKPRGWLLQNRRPVVAATPKPTTSVSVGNVTATIEDARLTASGRLSWCVRIAKDGAEVKVVRLTDAVSLKRQALRELAIFGDQAEAKYEEIKLAADKAARTQAAEPTGLTIRQVVQAKVPSVFQLVCRTNKGAWSESLGCEITRQDFMAYCPGVLVDEASDTVDAPRDHYKEVKRPALLRYIKAELEILWSDIVRALPDQSQANLDKESALGREFYGAVIRAWTETKYESGLPDERRGHYTPSGQVSLASRVAEKIAQGELMGRWEQILSTKQGYWRRTDERVYLGMRWTLGKLPGVHNQESLTRLGTMFGVIDPEPDIPGHAKQGTIRVAVLTKDITDELVGEKIE